MKHGLGRGLASLQQDLSNESSNIPVLSGGDRVVVRGLPLDQIKPNPNQPRKTFDPIELAELSKSIAEKGVLQPILVRSVYGTNHQYEIIAGERRYRASIDAGLTEIPALIKAVTPENAMEIALIENIQRENLNPIEEATGYQNLMDKCGYSLTDLEKMLGKSISYLKNSLRLTSLPEHVQQMVIEKKLTAGAARALIVTENASELAEKIVSENLSVRQVEDLVKDAPRKSSRGRSESGMSRDEIKKIEQQVRVSMGLRTKLDVKSAGNGSIILYFESEDERRALIKFLTKR